MLKSVKRAIDVLNLFTSGEPEIGISQIARELGMNKSTAARVIYSLECQGMLAKSTASRKYRLGGMVLQLAGALISKMELRSIALPYMKELHGRTNETISIYVLEHDHRVCIERIEGSLGARHVIAIGDRGPLHAGASGKVLLAYLPRERRNELINELKLASFTPYTITDKEKLQRELDEIRERGVAVSMEERFELCASVSAPIRNYMGDVIAALSISTLASRLTPGKVSEYSTLVKDAALEISHEFGFGKDNLTA
ncbi:MAG TPA: IclR family transcriptional regulator [Dehalococcoidia bacterium]|nr:IclR family transcriptional regulator [Dehalococcoidia bacterium]